MRNVQPSTSLFLVPVNNAPSVESLLPSRALLGTGAWIDRHIVHTCWVMYVLFTGRSFLRNLTRRLPDVQSD